MSIECGMDYGGAYSISGFLLFNGFVSKTITLDTDCLYRMAGKWMIWFCEKPRMAFAYLVDEKVMNLVHFLIWFSKNPAVALSIKRREFKLKVKKLVMNPEGVEEYKRIIEEERRKYPGELPKLTLGASLVLILLSFSLYLMLYLLIK